MRVRAEISLTFQRFWLAGVDCFQRNQHHTPNAPPFSLEKKNAWNKKLCLVFREGDRVTSARQALKKKKRTHYLPVLDDVDAPDAVASRDLVEVAEQLKWRVLHRAVSLVSHLTPPPSKFQCQVFETSRQTQERETAAIGSRGRSSG